MTNKQKEKIAFAIRKFLDDNCLNGDCRIYFNGKCWQHDTEDSFLTWSKELEEFVDVPERTPWKTIEDIDPRDYFDYNGDILSMSFEGSFYDVMNGYSKRDFRLQDEFHELLQKFGVYSELGNAWNLSLFEC